jgi:hypothetical protein
MVHPKKFEKLACVKKLAPPKEDNNVLMKMPYRLVYAVATNDTGNSILSFLIC